MLLQAGVNITDDGVLVGDTDGQGFGVGVAPKSAKADPSAVVQLKKKEKEKDRRGKGRDAKRYSTMHCAVNSNTTVNYSTQEMIRQEHYNQYVIVVPLC